jgi:hypothetical protein
MAPATEKSYGEAGVLLATDYGELRNFHKLANVMAKFYGENACQQASIWVVFGSLSLCFFLSLAPLSLSLILSKMDNRKQFCPNHELNPRYLRD